MSNLTNSACQGLGQLSLTLLSSVVFLAESMTQAPHLLNSQARYYPIPEEAPVIHTVCPLQSGLVIFLRMKAIKAQATKAMTRLVIIVHNILKIILFLMQEKRYVFTKKESTNQKPIQLLIYALWDESFSFRFFHEILKNILTFDDKDRTMFEEIKQPKYLFIFKLQKNGQDSVIFGNTFQNIIQNKFYRNMQQTLKSPRCRQPNPYKKVTVVPFDFGNASTLQPALETRSSRSNSKTKIRLVSPMRKLNQTAFMSKINQPSYLSETQKSVISPRNTVQIQLGGRNSSKNKENTLQTSQKLSKSNYNNPYLRSSQHIIQKVCAPPIVQIHQPFPALIQSQSKMSSPNKSVHIKYAPTPFIINREPSSPHAETKPSITFMHVRRNSSGINIPQTKPNFPTELQIREGDVIEQLKESYECELNDIKRLKQEIEQNNQEIKKLLKSSRASKETTKSKTLLEEHIEKQTINFKEESIKNIASIENLRLIKGQKEDNQISILDYERKQKAIGSKKTLINALYFQTQQKLENLANNNNSLLQNQAIQTQEITLPLFSKHSSFEARSSQRQFKLTLNNVCQVQCVGSSSNNLVSQPIALQDSIICQKQAVIKVQSKKHMKQQTKNKRSQKLQNIQNVTELKKQSLKMISSIKSLTKVGYDSDIKQKTQKMSQSKTSLHKIQVDDHLENILPVSQKSIKLEKQKSQATIPLVIQTKKNEVKVPEMNFQTKQNSMMDKQANKTWSQNNKIKQLNIVVKDDTQQPKSSVMNPKKGRKINNSIYL